MKLNEMLRYCAIKKNDNFRLLDTGYMSESERIFLLTILCDDRIEKHFFDFSEKIYRCNKLQKSIDYYKNRLRHAETIVERQKCNYELEDLQSLLNDMILSLLR